MLTVIICWKEQLSSRREFLGIIGIELDQKLDHIIFFCFWNLFLQVAPLENWKSADTGYVKSFLLQVQHNLQPLEK